MGYSLPEMEHGAGDANESAPKGAQMLCLIATQSIVLKYFEMQQYLAMYSEWRTWQFCQFVVGKGNYNNLLKNVNGSLEDSSCKEVVVFPREEHTACSSDNFVLCAIL